MTTQFSQQVFGFRFVDTNYGDTLQAICARELGDATVWAQVAQFNGLTWPYITDDPEQVAPGVVLSGTQIKLPAPTATVSATVDPTAVFGTDMQLAKGKLVVGPNGDFATVSGVPNLEQALQNLIPTNKGDLVMHASYGTDVPKILGSVNGPTSALLGAQYAKTGVQTDPRIDSVTSSIANVSGDQNTITVVAQTIAGKTLTVTSDT